MNSEENDDYFEAEQILDCRTNPKTKEKEYLVKWMGYSHDDNTWEPISHLSSAQDLLNAYHMNRKEKKKSEAKKKQEKTPPTPIVKEQKMIPEKQVQKAAEPTPINFEHRQQLPTSVEKISGNPPNSRPVRNRQNSSEVRNEIDSSEYFQIIKLGMKNNAMIFFIETDNDKFWVSRQAIFPQHAHKLCLFYQGHLRVRSA